MGKLLTCYAPFRRSPPEYCYPALPLDLHVLSLPLAFILSQDQTLLCIFFIFLSLTPDTLNSLKELTLSFFFSRYLLVLVPVFSMIFPFALETPSGPFAAPALRTGLQRYCFFFIPQIFLEFF